MATTFVVGDYLYTLVGGSSVHAQANDKTKTSYAPIPSSVSYSGKTYTVSYISGIAILDGTSYRTLLGCFEGCTNLISAPAIPSHITYLDSCFCYCTSLENAPIIPSGVTSMRRCFAWCESLINAPTIPNNVTAMEECFAYCKSLINAPTIPGNVATIQDCFRLCLALQGEVVINANASNYAGIFTGTQKGLWLTGSSSQLQAYANTATKGNVFVGEIPLGGSLTAERVGSDGGTTPDPEGNWLHVVLSISWSKFSSNSLSSITIYDNNILNPVTWYTDASKTSAIILPNWRPDPTVEAHTWLYIDEDTHTIQVNIADAYHTGAPVVITVPQVFRTVDFLAGGKGVAFGKVAGHEGFDCAMDALFEAGTFLGLDTTAQSGVDKDIYDALVLLGWDSDVIE